MSAGNENRGIAQSGADIEDESQKLRQTEILLFTRYRCLCHLVFSISLASALTYKSTRGSPTTK